MSDSTNSHPHASADDFHADQPSSAGGGAGEKHRSGPLAFSGSHAGESEGERVSRELMAAAGLSGAERARGAGRRLSEFSRRAEEGELTTEQFLFVMAIEEFKKGNGRTYPAWTDVLEVVRLLGYRKVQASEIVLRNAEDWREAATAPSNVRPQGWEKRFRLNKGPDGPTKHAA